MPTPMVPGYSLSKDVIRYALAEAKEVQFRRGMLFVVLLYSTVYSVLLALIQTPTKGETFAFLFLIAAATTASGKGWRSWLDMWYDRDVDPHNNAHVYWLVRHTGVGDLEWTPWGTD